MVQRTGLGAALQRLDACCKVTVRRSTTYGLGHWRKCKGVARVKLNDGSIRLAELHWYEATGIGRYEFKIKTYLD